MSIESTIIITDRDPIVSNVLRVEFSARDFLVLLAVDPEEAEDYAAQTSASLVVLDVGAQRLPVFSACARIRRMNGYARCPIVLTAMQVTQPVREAATTAGATLVLAKDYSFTDLVKAVLPHVPAQHPVARKLTPAPGAAMPAQKEWKAAPAFSWQFGENSQLSANAKLMPVVRGAGVRVPVLKMGRVNPL
jgi:DNA-binding response OmpR family regulator